MKKDQFLSISLPHGLKCQYQGSPDKDHFNKTGIYSSMELMEWRSHDINKIGKLRAIAYRKYGSKYSVGKTPLYVKTLYDPIPILRPLSDLTKPIEHKGETFIPIVKIAEILGYENISLKGNDCQVGLIESGSSYIKETLRYTDNYFYIDVEDYYYSSDSVKRYKDGIFMDHFQLFQKLIEWHFNLMDEDEEFIDVNTLEINPYK